MTLVMSMSIIGISADYTLYYLTERMVRWRNSPWQSRTKVRNAAAAGASDDRRGVPDYDAGPSQDPPGWRCLPPGLSARA